MYDLIVIGGGPAGTSAAIAAARGGARVLLLERGRFPRHKVCGEFVSAESLDLLADLLDESHAALMGDAARIRNARVFLDGRVIETAVTPAAASIARLDLDAALWDSAERAGAEARQQTTVKSIEQASGDGGRFRVTTSAGEFESRALVNASGRWSNLNPVAGGDQRLGPKWLGLKGHFAEGVPSSSVDLYFFDGGYCGVQPVDTADGISKATRINACAMVRADVANTLPEVFGLHPDLKARSRGWEALSDPVSTSPLIFREPLPEINGALMVGDAAGFVDPFVGDGISLALRSGALAAESLSGFFKGEINLRASAKAYRESYMRRLWPVFRTSSKIRRMLLLPRSVRTPILFLLENTPVITRYLVSRTR